MSRMHVFMSMLVITIMLCIAKAEAGYVLIEEERDIIRVGNNFSAFYKENQEDLDEIRRLGSGQNLNKINIERIMNKKDGLTGEIVRAYQNNKNDFILDLKQTDLFIKNNQPLIMENFKEEGNKLRCFILGYNSMIKLITQAAF